MGARPKRILISDSLSKLRIPQAQIQSILQNLKPFEKSLSNADMQTVVNALVKDASFRADFLKNAKSAVQNLLK